MGGKSGGGGSSGSNFGYQNTTSTYAPAPEAMAAFRRAIGMAENVTSQPFEPYQGAMVAGFTPDQMQAMQGVRQMQGMVQPYINAATGLQNQALGYSDPRMFNERTMAQYQSPYQKQVVDATMANLAQLNAQQEQQGRTAAAQRGTFGGSGEFQGRAEIARQQAMANAQTLAGLQQQGYQQAVAQYNQQQQQAIQTAQNASYGLGQLGQSAQQAALQGIQALMGTGGQQQALAQQQLTGAYQQWLQAKAFPYQQAAFYSGIAGGIAPNMGGTTNTSGFSMGNSQQQQSGGGGGGMGGMASSMMSMLPMLFGSDREDKTDIKYLGKDDSGEKIYEYRYKGDPKSYPKVVGPMAQDIEEHSPERVHEIGGHKVVEGFGGLEPYHRQHRADGGGSGSALGAASGTGSLGSLSSTSAPTGQSAASIYDVPAADSSSTQQALGAMGSTPTQGGADPNVSSFIQGIFDPKTADQMARAKWVNQPQEIGQQTFSGDNYVIPPRLMNDGSQGYPYHPQAGSPMADGGRAEYAQGGAPGGMGGGSFFDLINKTQSPYAMPGVNDPGTQAMSKLGPGQVMPMGQDKAKAVTGEAASAMASSLMSDAMKSGKGGGGGGSGGGGGGGMKMPKLGSPKSGGEAAAAGAPEEAAHTPEAPAADAAAAAPAPEAHAPDMGAMGGMGGMGTDIPLFGMFGGFRDGGRVHKDGGGAAGGIGAAAPGGGFGVLGQPGTGMGDVVLGGAGSPGDLAGLGDLMAGQENLTGNALLGKWNEGVWARDPGVQKSPVEQGMPAMPDSSFYTTPRKDLPSVSATEHYGEQNPGLDYGMMAMAGAGMGGKGGMGGPGMMALMGQSRADAQNADAKAKQAELKATRESMLKDPANFPVQGYFATLDSTPAGQPTMGMQLNPRTGLYNLGYTGAYRGYPYKEGGRVPFRKGGKPQQVGGYNFRPEFGSNREALMTAAAAEAGGEFKNNPEMRQKAIEAVMHNIQNRALGGFKLQNKSSNEYWKTHDPHSIQDQVLAPKQYSSFNPNSPKVNIAGRNAIQNMQDPKFRAEYEKYADDVMGRMSQDPTQGSSNYRNSAQSSKASNEWFNKLQNKVDIGHHTFGRAPGFNIPEDKPTSQIGDTAMLQNKQPSEQAMQMAGLSGSPQPTMMAQGEPKNLGALPQIAEAKAPEPAPMQVADNQTPLPPSRPAEISVTKAPTDAGMSHRMSPEVRDMYYNKAPAPTSTPVTPSTSTPHIPSQIGIKPPMETASAPAPMMAQAPQMAMGNVSPPDTTAQPAQMPGMDMQQPDMGMPMMEVGNAPEMPAMDIASNAPDMGGFEIPEFAADGGRIGMKEGGSPERLNAQMLYKYIMDKTGDQKLAAMLTGNAAVESGFNPYVMHDKNTGFGLWGHGKDRWQDMQRFTGMAKPGWQQQADFAIHEMMTSPKVGAARAALRLAKDPREIALAGMHFERPQGYSQSNPAGGMGFAKRYANIADIYKFGDASHMKMSSALPSMAASGSYGYVPPSNTGYTGSSAYGDLRLPSQSRPLPMGEGSEQQPLIMQILNAIFGGIGDLFGVNDDQQQSGQRQQPAASGQPAAPATTAPATEEKPETTPTSPPAVVTTKSGEQKYTDPNIQKYWENRPAFGGSKASTETPAAPLPTFAQPGFGGVETPKSEPAAPVETKDMNQILPQQGFGMMSMPQEDTGFSVDEQPLEEKRKGGRVRKKYATDGSVKDKEASKTETPIESKKESAPKTEEKPVELPEIVLPSSRQPASQPGFGGLMGQEGQDLYQQWRTNPMSQFLWNLGQHMMAHGDKPIGEAVMGAMPHAMGSLQEVMEYQHKLAQKQAEEKAHMDFVRSVNEAAQQGYASGGAIRRKYATDGAVMDEGGDFFGDLGSLFGGDEQQAAPRQPARAPAQAEQGGDFLGSLFGGEEAPQPAAPRAQPMAYAAQQEAPGGFFDDLFGATPEQAQPAQRAPAGRQVAQAEPQGNILDDILGGIFGGGAEAAPARTPSIAPRTEPKAAGKPAEPAKLEEPAKAPEGAPKPTEPAPAPGGEPASRGAPAQASIYDDPRIQQLNREIKAAERATPRTREDQTYLTNYINSRLRERKDLVTEMRQDQLFQLQKQKLENAPKPQSSEEKVKEKIAIGTGINEQRAITDSKKKATEILKQGLAATDNARLLDKTVDEVEHALNRLESGSWTPAMVQGYKMIPQSLRTEAQQQAVEDAETLDKLNAQMVQQYTKGFSGAVRVAEINMGQKGVPSANLAPNTNRGILADYRARAQLQLDYNHDKQEFLKKNKQPTTEDLTQFDDDWMSKKGHSYNDYYNKAYDKIHIKGAKDDEKHIPLPSKTRAEGEPSGGSEQPQYSIQPGHMEGDWVYKGGDPNDKSSWEHK